MVINGFPRDWEEVTYALPGTPTQRGQLTADGTEQSPEWEGYQEEWLLLEGVTAAVEAGVYTAAFTTREGYCWEDGSRGTREVNWSIT